jgi:DNA-nicking Smr family endonuclease
MSRGRKGRELRPDEQMLWNKVAETLEHRTSEHAGYVFPIAGLPSEITAPKPPEVDGPKRQLPVAKFSIGERSTRTTPSVVPNRSSAMDKKALNRLQRGKLPVEGTLDLHGMSVGQAHPTLVHFVINAAAKGKRLLLVITGKGGAHKNDHLSSEPGILRRSVPQWIRIAPLNLHVMEVVSSHISHGGTGAYYVYLRRRK